MRAPDCRDSLCPGRSRVPGGKRRRGGRCTWRVAPQTVPPLVARWCRDPEERNLCFFCFVYTQCNKSNVQKVSCEKYKFYMFTFDKMCKGILWRIHAFVMNILGTSAQPVHSNDLSNIGNQKSHLIFWQHKTLRTNNSSNLTNLLY